MARRPLPRLVKYLIALPLLTPISATVLLTAGPVWTDSRQDAPETPRLAQIEESYQARVGDAPLVIVDLPALTPPRTEAQSHAPPSSERIRAHVAARLNAHGNYVNTVWPLYSQRIARNLASANARTLWFAGGPHGSGLIGHFDMTPAVVVTPGSPAMLAEHPSLEQGFIGLRAPVSRPRDPSDWMDFILLHELEHAVDKAQYSRLWKTFARGFKRRLTGLIGPDTTPARLKPDPLVRTSGEIFADLGAAVAYIRRSEDRDAALSMVTEIAYLRALGPVWTAAAGERPYLGHFTSLALLDLLADIAAGDDAILKATGDRLTTALDARREAAVAALERLDLSAFDDASEDSWSLDDGIQAFRRAGAPPRLIDDLRAAVRWYTDRVVCYSRARAGRGAASLSELARSGRAALTSTPVNWGSACRHIDNTGKRSWIDLPARLFDS